MKTHTQFDKSDHDFNENGICPCGAVSLGEPGVVITVFICVRCKAQKGEVWCSECQGYYCEGCYFLDPHREEGLEK